jgi:sugar O-acyltransferase (sialic acid O-acetyltransferase NeuD family)
MLIIGAKGHAKEILDILYKQKEQNIVLFDNISEYQKSALLYNHYKIITSLFALEEYFKNNDLQFCTGIGGTKVKASLVEKIEALGGQYETIVADNAIIGSFDVIIGQGCNIMQNVFISNSVKLGKGCLINYGATLHHDINIGNYCEVSPNATILGRCDIGNYVSIGANSTILPDVVIGDYAKIGAGAVVTKNVEPKTTVVGIPAK